jgi:hypothetical protein
MTDDLDRGSRLATAGYSHYTGYSHFRRNLRERHPTRPKLSWARMPPAIGCRQNVNHDSNISG